MATHSSMLAWEIPWTEEAGGLYSPGGHKSQTQVSDQTTTTIIIFVTTSFSYPQLHPKYTVEGVFSNQRYAYLKALACQILL